MDATKKDSKNPFSPSDAKHGLWVPLNCKVNKVQSDETAEALTELFILTADSQKVLTTAQAIVAIGDGIADAASFTFQAGKANKMVAELTVSGAEVKARAAAIVHMHETARNFKIVHEAEETGEKAARQPRKNKLAGFVTK